MCQSQTAISFHEHCWAGSEKWHYIGFKVQNFQVMPIKCEAEFKGILGGESDFGRHLRSALDRLSLYSLLMYHIATLSSQFHTVQ